MASAVQIFFHLLLCQTQSDLSLLFTDDYFEICSFLCHLLDTWQVGSSILWQVKFSSIVWMNGDRLKLDLIKSNVATLYGRWRHAQSTVRSSLIMVHIQINTCCWTMALLSTTIPMMSVQLLLVMCVYVCI